MNRAGDPQTACLLLPTIRITRWIGKWAFDLRDEGGMPVFGGIRYLSRLNTDWECWAVFHDVEIKERSRQPIERGTRHWSRSRTSSG